jgi:hypothetical protein
MHLKRLLIIFTVFLYWLPAWSGIQPGEIYREYSVNMRSGDKWRVTDPNAEHPDAANFLPNPVLSINIDDLDKSVRAEVLLDIWGGHIGTTGRKFSFNNQEWIDIPLPSTGTNLDCYITQFNVTIDLPLEDLVEGQNTFKGTSGGQLCHDFGWGHYLGYDEDGDGEYIDWHRDYHGIEISGHIGTKKSAPWQFSWNTRYVPDQESKSMSFLASTEDPARA